MQVLLLFRNGEANRLGDECVTLTDPKRRGHALWEPPREELGLVRRLGVAGEGQCRLGQEALLWFPGRGGAGRQGEQVENWLL